MVFIIRAQFSQQRKYWIYKHVGKARFRFKSPFYDNDGEFKNEINNTLKEMQESTNKHVEDLKEENENSPKEIKEYTP